MLVHTSHQGEVVLCLPPPKACVVAAQAQRQTTEAWGLRLLRLGAQSEGVTRALIWAPGRAGPEGSCQRAVVEYEGRQCDSTQQWFSC